MYYKYIRMYDATCMYDKYRRMYIYIHIDTLVAHLYAFRGVVKIQFPCVCVCARVCMCVSICMYVYIPPESLQPCHSRARRHLLKNEFSNLLPICDRPSTLASYLICDQHSPLV